MRSASRWRGKTKEKTPMLLAIDIGNTNIEFGVFEGETLLRSARHWHQPGTHKR